MPAGNLNTSGAQGKNTSYQRSVLALLSKVYQPIGYQQLTVTGANAQSLTVPEGARYMEIRVESATTTGIIMWYLLLGNTTLPTTASGMPLVYLDLFDVTGEENIKN